MVRPLLLLLLPPLPRQSLCGQLATDERIGTHAFVSSREDMSDRYMKGAPPYYHGHEECAIHSLPPRGGRHSSLTLSALAFMDCSVQTIFIQLRVRYINYVVRTHTCKSVRIINMLANLSRVSSCSVFTMMKKEDGKYRASVSIGK